MNKPVVFGFRDEKTLVRTVADALGFDERFIIEDAYDGGERFYHAKTAKADRAYVVADIMPDPSFFFRVLAAATLLKEAGYKRVSLVAPFIAYGRQDRAVSPGEAPLGRMIGDTLSRHFDEIVTLDAHSRDFIDTFRGRLTSVYSVPPKNTFSFQPTYVVAPDKGAVGRARAFAAAYRLPVLALSKKRFGRRVHVMLPNRKSLFGQRALLVDDMADSGATLFEADELLHRLGVETVGVSVTHLIDNKKRPRTFAKDFADVVVAYDHRTGCIEPWALRPLLRALVRR